MTSPYGSAYESNAGGGAGRLSQAEESQAASQAAYESNAGGGAGRLSQAEESQASANPPKLTDLGAAQEFMKVISYTPHFDVEHRSLLGFDAATGLWTTDEQFWLKEFAREKEILGSHATSYKKALNLMAMLKSEARDEGFIARMDDSSDGCWLTLDGVYDAKTKTFTFAYDQSKLFNYRLPWAFPVDVELAYKTSVRMRVFIHPYGEAESKYLVHFLARALLGYRDKTIGIICGDSNGGKVKYCGRSIVLF